METRTHFGLSITNFGEDHRFLENITNFWGESHILWIIKFILGENHLFLGNITHFGSKSGHLGGGESLIFVGLSVVDSGSIPPFLGADSPI